MAGTVVAVSAQALIKEQQLADNANIEVTLHKPIPLDSPLYTRPHGSKVKFVDQHDNLIATARSAELSFPTPAALDLDSAIHASKHYVGFDFHPYASCFVCGTERHQGDGLQIYPGKVNGKKMVAAPWHPFPALADEKGFIKAEIIWAALDCLSYYGVLLDTNRDNALLGRMSLQQFEQDIAVDDQYIISAWSDGSDGRKHYGIAALFSQQGSCLAIARGTWIKI